DGFAGADPKYRSPVRVITEFAWQNLFMRQMLRRPDEDAAPPESQTPAEGSAPPEGPASNEGLPHARPFTLIAAPGCTADPSRHHTHSEAFVLIDLSRRLGLVGGTHYAGELKKMIFSVMNYELPA